MEAPFVFGEIDFSLMAPELWMTLLTCLVLAIDFLFPKVKKNTLAYGAIAGMAAVAIQLALFFISGKSGLLFNGMFVLDPLAIFFKIFVLFSTILIVLSSLNYVNTLPFYRGEYYFLLLFSALGMMFMASANDLLSLYITLEFATFGFYILVAYLREDLHSNEAGIKFFILGVLASSIVIFGISLIYGATGTIVFQELAGHPPSMGMIVGLMCVLMGLGYKVGAVPFHAWIPDVYEGAPTPVTSFLAIVPKGAAFAVILRIIFSAFPAVQGEWTWFLIVISALSMTYGNIVAIAQKNMKRLLAYSGIAQIGNILIGLAAGTRMGGDAILFYMLAYLFANIGAFAVVIVVGGATAREDIEGLAGLNRRSPFLAFSLLIFLLSLAGVPPLAGFMAKLYVFMAAMNRDLFFLVIVGLVNIVISMYYYLVVVKKIYILEPQDATPIITPWPLKIVLVVSVAGVLVLGIFPRPFVGFSEAATVILSNLALR